MFIKVNDVELNYEVYGKGEPIIFLHGNGESFEIFKQIPELIQNYKVYLVDSRGHGKSSKVSEITYNLIASDIHAFISKLDIKKPIIFGFSDGGIVGLILAINYPNLLSKLIAAGANTNPQGIKTKWRVLMRLTYFFTRSVNYKMMLTQPNITNNDLKKIITPTLILAGNDDMVSTKHTLNIGSHIKNHIINIIPNENHFSYIFDNIKLYGAIKEFIN